MGLVTAIPLRGWYILPQPEVFPPKIGVHDVEVDSEAELSRESQQGVEGLWLCHLCCIFAMKTQRFGLPSVYRAPVDFHAPI